MTRTSELTPEDLRRAADVGADTADADYSAGGRRRTTLAPSDLWGAVMPGCDRGSYELTAVSQLREAFDSGYSDWA